MQIRLLISYVTRVTIYIIFLYSMSLYILMTIQTRITFYNLDHVIFKKQKNILKMRCYTVLWKLCADLNNVQN